MAEEISYIQFAARHGLVTDYDVQGHIHGGLRAAHMPASFHRRYQQRLQDLQEARAEGMARYAAAIEAGEVSAPREPSSFERLVAKADGHPDLESTRAAKRTLARIFEKRAESTATNALSSQQQGTENG